MKTTTNTFHLVHEPKVIKFNYSLSFSVLLIFWNTRWSLVFVLLWWKRTEIRNDLTIKLVHNKKILCQEIVYHLFYSINLKLNLDGFEFNSRNIWFILPIKSLRFVLTFILNRREGCCIQYVARLDNKFLWTLWTVYLRCVLYCDCKYLRCNCR